MFAIIVLSILTIALLVVIGLAVARVAHPAVVAIPVLLLFLMWVVFSFATVAPKHIGVAHTFGAVSDDHLEPGPHFKLPWTNVTELDGTVQSDEYRGDDCITVILADKNTACISATNRWAVNPDGADRVFADYRSDDPTEQLRDAVVSTEFKAAVFDAFGDVDPTEAGALDTAGLADEIKTATQDAAGELVAIGRVTISYVRLGEKAQAKIDAIEAQEAQTTIAAEKIETAKKEAEANRILSDSISQDPNVLVSKCLDMVADGASLPAGFQCWSGTGGSLVLPSAK